MLAEKLFESRSIGLVVSLKTIEMGGAHLKIDVASKICACFTRNRITNLLQEILDPPLPAPPEEPDAALQEETPQTVLI